MLFLQPHWSHSSMDRISDSGSDDLGSSPDGITFRFDYHEIADVCVHFVRAHFVFMAQKKRLKFGRSCAKYIFIHYKPRSEYLLVSL